MWDLKKMIQMNLFTKIETQRANLWLPKGMGGRDKLGWG